MDTNLDTSISLSSSTAEDNEENLCFNVNGSISSGNLKALIERLFPTKDYSPSDDYVFSFLLNVRLFCDLPDILHEFVKFFIFEQNAKTENFRKENRLQCVFNVLKFLSQWCDDFPADFYSDQMKKRLKELLDLCCSTDPALLAYRSNLIENLQQKLSKLSRLEKELSELQAMIDATVSRTEIDHVPRTSYDILDSGITPRHMAEQLTIIEQEKMNSISPEEFVYIFDVTGDYHAKIEPKHSCASKIRAAKNVQNYVCWCNRLNNFVATEICKKARSKTRSKALEFFIDVAKECFNMGNFNSCVAIISALNMNAVKRLYKTWSRIDDSKLKILERSMDPKKNFFNYRSTLQAAIWRCNELSSSTSNICRLQQVVIPAFCVLCRDLYVTQSYCKQMLSNGHLNFNAFSEFGQIVRLFIQWKNVQHCFEKDVQLYKYILTKQVLDEKNLDFLSYECEPPDTNKEKISYKKLKMEFSHSDTQLSSSM